MNTVKLKNQQEPKSDIKTGDVFYRKGSLYDTNYYILSIYIHEDRNGVALAKYVAVNLHSGNILSQPEDSKLDAVKGLTFLGRNVKIEIDNY